MHVRRALLLFAIVLGLAAFAAAVSQPREEAREPPPRELSPPTATPGPARPSEAELEFSVKGRPRTRNLPVGRSATVLVQVPGPGEVTLDGLGLVASADRLTPARFDVLGRRPGRHGVSFKPAGGYLVVLFRDPEEAQRARCIPTRPLTGPRPASAPVPTSHLHRRTHGRSRGYRGYETAKE